MEGFTKEGLEQIKNLIVSNEAKLLEVFGLQDYLDIRRLAEESIPANEVLEAIKEEWRAEQEFRECRYWEGRYKDMRDTHTYEEAWQCLMGVQKKAGEAYTKRVNAVNIYMDSIEELEEKKNV